MVASSAQRPRRADRVFSPDSLSATLALWMRRRDAITADVIAVDQSEYVRIFRCCVPSYRAKTITVNFP